MRELHEWLGQPEPETFPYAAVAREIRNRGKQFTDIGLLRLLDQARTAGDTEVRRFLDVVLDKYDGTFANRSYLALDLLGLPDADDAAAAQHRRDRLHYLLVTDLAHFEAGPEQGELEPEQAVVAKRLRLAERAVAPIRERVGAPPRTDEEVRLLEISMLPVTRMHDERMFIRVMQTYEATFALVAAYLGEALKETEPAKAARALVGAEQALAEAAPLFSLVATMQRDAFLEFRQYTQGATAMQSPHYALIQSRLGQLRASIVDASVLAAESALGERLQMWRQTHYRIAMRLLGDLPGTGSTDGAAYLDRARTAA